MDNIIRYSVGSAGRINLAHKLYCIFIFLLFLISVCFAGISHSAILPQKRVEDEKEKKQDEYAKVRLLIPNFVMKGGDIRFGILRHSLPELLAISLITDEKIEYVSQEDALRTITTDLRRDRLIAGPELLSDSKNLDALHIDLILVGSFIEYKGSVSFDAILEDRRTKERYSLSSKTVSLAQIYSEVEQFARSLNAKIGDITLRGAANRIAVLCFKDTSKIPLDANKWLQEDIAASLSLTLEKNRALLVVPFTDAKKYCQDDKSRIGKIDSIKLDAIIDGTFSIEENKMSIEPKFYIVETGQSISLSRITDDSSKYYTLSNRLAQSVSYVLNAITSAKGTWNVETLQFTSDNIGDYIKKGNEYLGIRANPYVAELMFSKAIEKEPEVLEGHFGRGVAKSKQYLHREALSEFETVITIINKKKERKENVAPVLEAKTHQEKGKVLFARGSYDQALEAFRKAKDIRPDLENIHLNLGEVYFIQKDYDKSKAEFRQALKYDPNNPDVYIGLGDTLLGQRLLDEAIQAYNKALALDMNNKVAMAGLSDANNQKALEFLSVGKYDQAIKIYQDLIKINADVTEDVYFGLGYAFTKKDRFEEAIDAYSKAIKIDPGKAGCYNNRGVAYNALKERDKALADFNTAIQLDPKYALSYFNRGVVYYDDNQNEKALIEFNKAIELNRKHSSTYLYRGLTYARLQDTEKAIEEYSKAIELDPKYVLAYSNRGVTYDKLGQNEKAVTDYSKAIELDPKYVLAYNNRGMTYDKLGQNEKAVTDYSKAIELDPKYVLAYNNRGVAYDKLGQNEKAVTDYSKAIELDPKYVLAYNNRGVAYAKLGRNEKAVTDYSKAIELDPKYVLAYNNRGVAYAKLGRNEKAVTDYSKAISIDPNYAPAYNSRGVLYVKLGKYDKAILDYKRANELLPKEPVFFLNLSEAYIISGKYENALSNIKQAFSLISKAEDKVINLYLETISKKLLNIDTTDSESALGVMLKQRVTADWSFNEIESWIKSANVSENIKHYVLEKTELVKEIVSPDRTK